MFTKIGGTLCTLYELRNLSSSSKATTDPLSTVHTYAHIDEILQLYEASDKFHTLCETGLYIAQSEKVSSGTSSGCADTLAARRLKGYVKIAFESSVITSFI